MEKIYIEQSVSGDKTARSSFLYILCGVLIALLLVLALISAANLFGNDPSVLSVNWINLLVLTVCLLLSAVLFLRRDHLRKEYDYILNDDVLEIYCILNRRRRRRLASVALDRITCCGPAASAVPKSGASKVHKWYLNAENSLYCICYKDENIPHAALLELNAALARQLRISKHLQLGMWKDMEVKGSNYAGLS